MADLTFHLLSVNKPADFIAALRALPKPLRPLYVGETKHWIHEPALSTGALTGSSPSPTLWTHLIVAPSNGADKLTLPAGIDASLVEHRWSIAAPVPEPYLRDYSTQHTRRQTSAAPPLPAGWSAEDHSGLDASKPPSDLSASLGLQSRPLGQRKPVVLKDFIATFATQHTGPVAMFNLLSYTPNGGREQYFGYVQAFNESVGIKYGGEPLFLGLGVTDWSSKGDQSEQGQKGGWEDCALVWYPSLWHFGKMLDDDGYAEADRKFKAGALVDNPLICCVEIAVGYID